MSSRLIADWGSDVGSFLDPLGIFDSGGSSATASVTSTVNLDVKGLDNIKETVTLAGGLTNTETLNLGGATTINQTMKLDPVELKPVTINENIDLKPVTLNENIDLKPVTFNENIDLKPVAIDNCQTFKLAPLPDTNVCQPYRHHVAYTIFGIEYAGVTYDGESKQLIESPRRAQVVQRLPRTKRREPRPARELSGNRGIRVRALDPDDE